jgi:hypothetical protein
MRCRHQYFLLIALALLQPATVRAAVTSSSSLVPPNAPQSTFADDPGMGRDPFFPNSQYRRPQVVKNPDTHTVMTGVPDFIKLQGISVVKDKRLAIINNYTLATGEEFSLRYGAQVVKVKLVEVKEASAVVSANGATKELTLRAGFN